MFEAGHSVVHGYTCVDDGYHTKPVFTAWIPVDETTNDKLHDAKNERFEMRHVPSHVGGLTVVTERQLAAEIDQSRRFKILLEVRERGDSRGSD